MLEELIERYSQYSDGELMTVYLNRDGYTEEAKKALETVVDRKGGIRALQDRYQLITEKEDEKSRIREEIAQLYNEGLTQNDIVSSLNSPILSVEELRQITEEIVALLELKKKDEKITSGTVVGSFLGGAIGGTVGGILWGVQMIYSGRMFFIFVLGLAIISYAFIKFFTKQSRNNIVVFAVTVMSVIYAVVLGAFIYDLFGYHGPEKF